MTEQAKPLTAAELAAIGERWRIIQDWDSEQPFPAWNSYKADVPVLLAEVARLQGEVRRLREALEDVRLDCFQKCEYVRCDHRIQDTVEEAVGPDALDNAAKRAATWSNMEDELIRLQKAERWLQVLMAYRADAEVGQVEAAMALGVKWNEVDTLADDAELQGYQIVEEALADKEGE